jgi:predicted nuclease with RNAse H fold
VPPRATARPAVAVGVDVGEERKGLDLVALDGRRRVVRSAGGLTVSQAATAILDELEPDVVCIDAPSGWAVLGPSRQAERALAGMGIRAFPTPPEPDPELSPGLYRWTRWMRSGIALFDAIGSVYRPFRGDDPRGKACEVFPHGSAMVLSGRPAERKPKLAFRRRVLTSHGIDLAPLPTIDRVDAALAALTGLIALEGAWTAVGDPDEGMVLLPGPPP